ncbi:MAG: tripartite tricarboxylate transporter substrate binding protein [Gammaproteobacteria bacterium]|nr:tripartite tricarboxylate transporter substrate binding protein [Gammaproteobacteria bacterium]
MGEARSGPPPGEQRLNRSLAVRRLCVPLAACAAFAVPAHAAQGGDYPNKPVRLIVVYPPGGGLDILARAMAQRFTESWGVPVVVDNRPGAGTTLGAAIAAKAPADGYTLLLTDVSFAITPALYSGLPYRVERDFAPVSLLNLVTDVLVVHPSMPAQNVRDLIQHAKANAGKLLYASAGNGTLNHLAPEMFKAQAGIDLVHVPYKGAVAAVADVMANRAQVYIGALGTALPLIRSNRLRALAVTGKKRASQLPDLPTVAEQGLPNYDVSAWYALVAPAGTPQLATQKVWREARASLDSAELRTRLLADGAEPVGSTPEELRAFLRDELVKWGQAVRAAGVKID